MATGIGVLNRQVRLRHPPVEAVGPAARRGALLPLGQQGEVELGPDGDGDGGAESPIASTKVFANLAHSPLWRRRWSFLGVPRRLKSTRECPDALRARNNTLRRRFQIRFRAAPFGPANFQVDLNGPSV